VPRPVLPRTGRRAAVVPRVGAFGGVVTPKLTIC